MSKRTMLAILTTLAVATACSSGGGNVTSPNSLNPTSAPTGITVTATPTSSSGTSASPTAVATATATPTAGTTASPISATPTPTPVATASASAVVATPTPTPAASASAGGGGLATTCVTDTASPSTMTYALTGAAETINLPNYPASPPYEITGTSDVPSQSPAGVTLTLVLSQQKIDNNEAAPSGQTADFYTTLEVNKSTTFGNGSKTLLIPVTITSPCVVAGRTYTVTESSSGLTVYTETDVAASAGSVTGHIEASLNPFPANTIADVVVSH